MSLLAFHQLETPERRLLQRPPWRYGLTIGLTLLGAAAMILWGATFEGQVAQGIVTEVGSWVLFTTVFCGLAWFRQPRAKRRTAVLFGFWAAVAIVVNAAAKHGLNQHFLAAGLGDSPRLYWAGLFFIPPTLLLWYSQRDQQMQQHGLHLRKWRDQVLLGLLAGVFIALHFLSTVRFSGIVGLSIKPLQYMFWSLGFEVFQSLGEELFFRGVLLRSLQTIYKLNFWLATAVTTVANLSIYLIRSQWQNPIQMVGVVIYLSMMSIAASLLFRRYQSVVPGYLCNIVFSFSAILR
ncbi:type II CAAX prenyl endopeptidase Rce1 family protein [Herpetosiphon giganteus]|uniref:CPBP family glutamic-type intramembrane protease n=1 Tax=Herpetosiphon giganteus TaxID=2029754 RepID=UPI001959C003|nr:CPBP family glutamic-type intramembrane protease [Herpetosiphon giganteus]MBM7842193.1 membrane protease YdiL (CAAX protease family) [Herpetosiphon giganteus]